MSGGGRTGSLDVDCAPLRKGHQVVLVFKLAVVVLGYVLIWLQVHLGYRRLYKDGRTHRRQTGPAIRARVVATRRSFYASADPSGEKPRDKAAPPMKPALQ